MKSLIKVLFFVILAMIAFGFYIKTTGGLSGDKWIGFGVLALAFILMPLFIYHRYKDKNLRDYSFKKKDNED